MARIDDLRADIEQARRALREAIEAVADQWNEDILEPEGELPWGGEQSWSPRDAATHVIVVEQLYVGYLGEAIAGRGDEPIGEWFRAHGGLQPRLVALRDELTEATKAIEGTSMLQALVSVDLSMVRNEDLQARAEISDRHVDYLAHFGYPAPKTVEGLLGLLACHMNDHSLQIRSAAE